MPNRSAYFPPLNKEDALDVAALGGDEQKWLDGVFNDPRFIAALRRANIQKPGTTVTGDAMARVERLANIDGWEGFEKALLTQHKQDPIVVEEQLEENYETDRELTDLEKAEKEEREEREAKEADEAK